MHKLGMHLSNWGNCAVNHRFLPLRGTQVRVVALHRIHLRGRMLVIQRHLEVRVALLDKLLIRDFGIPIFALD